MSQRHDEPPTLVFDGGPRHDETDSVDPVAPVIGDGSDGGVYERTGDRRHDVVVYRWRSLRESEVDALVRGDLRANQDPG